jgi:hypothetical protein
MIKIRTSKDAEFRTLKIYIGWGRTRLRLVFVVGRRQLTSDEIRFELGWNRPRPIARPEGRAEFCFVTMDRDVWAMNTHR